MISRPGDRRTGPRASTHSNIRWGELHWGLGCMPRPHLREPLQKHQQSVLPRLEKRRRAELCKEWLDLLIKHLEEEGGVAPPYLPFESWGGQLLSDGNHEVELGLLNSPLLQDAPIYDQGCLGKCKDLQRKRPAAPGEGKSLHYHYDTT